MAFGQKYTTSTALNGGGGAMWIKRFPRDTNQMRIRPLTEPDGFRTWNEVWDSDINRGWPIDLESGQMPEEHQEVRRKPLIAILNVDEDRVWAFACPKSVSDALSDYFKVKGSITGSDFVITKQGTGLDTKYALIHDRDYPLDLSKYELPNLEQVLMDAHQHAVDEGWTTGTPSAPDEPKLSPVPDPEPAPAVGEDGLPEGWRDSTLSKIRELARERGINPSGHSKAELIEAIDGTDGF